MNKTTITRPLGAWIAAIFLLLLTLFPLGMKALTPIEWAKLIDRPDAVCVVLVGELIASIILGTVGILAMCWLFYPPPLEHQVSTHSAWDEYDKALLEWVTSPAKVLATFGNVFGLLWVIVRYRRRERVEVVGATILLGLFAATYYFVFLR